MKDSYHIFYHTVYQYCNKTLRFLCYFFALRMTKRQSNVTKNRFHTRGFPVSYRKTIYCRPDWCAWEPRKKKIISTSVSLLYVHHCNMTGNPSASEYSACHQSTLTVEWEPHASIYLMPSCDGWPHLLEIQTWESPSNHNMWCCQHFPLWSVLLLLDSLWFTLLGVVLK